MAPIVHGLEDEYGDRVDFLYLDISDPANRAAMDTLGFRSTPHFFMRTADGATLREWAGRVVDRDSLVAALRIALE